MNTEVKERILIRAADLFMQFGIRSISMDDIANHLGMSKKTLYQYYADKDELVHAVIDSKLNDVQNDCLSCVEDAKDAVHELVITIERVLTDLSNINPMVIHDLEKFHNKAFKRFMEYKNKFLAQTIRRNLEWGMEEELYRPDLNIEILVQYRLEGMMLSFDPTVYPPGKFNLLDTSSTIMEHFIYGLVTAKGHKLIQKYNQQRQQPVVAAHHKLYGK